jgi:mono/diheme cytochrome c family protein
MKHTATFGLIALLAGAALFGCDDKPKPGQWPLSHDELVAKTKTQPTSNFDEAAAELTYKRYCVGCHGDDGRGNGGTTGADLSADNSPLATKRNDVLIASVRDGKLGKTGTMPPHKPVLKDEQIADVIRFLRRRFVHPEPPAP